MGIFPLLDAGVMVLCGFYPSNPGTSAIESLCTCPGFLSGCFSGEIFPQGKDFAHLLLDLGCPGAGGAFTV